MNCDDECAIVSEPVRVDFRHDFGVLGTVGVAGGKVVQQRPRHFFDGRGRHAGDVAIRFSLDVAITGQGLSQFVEREAGAVHVAVPFVLALPPAVPAFGDALHRVAEVKPGLSDQQPDARHANALAECARQVWKVVGDVTQCHPLKAVVVEGEFARICPNDLRVVTRRSGVNACGRYAALVEAGVDGFQVEARICESSVCSAADLAEPFGQIDVFDLLAYIDLYSASDPGTDLAAPFGTVDIFDLLDFVTHYSNGCP